MLISYLNLGAGAAASSSPIANCENQVVFCNILFMSKEQPNKQHLMEIDRLRYFRLSPSSRRPDENEKSAVLVPVLVESTTRALYISQVLQYLVLVLQYSRFKRI
jgi:hypothetical protein